jgi:hypothetical protein
LLSAAVSTMAFQVHVQVHVQGGGIRQPCTALCHHNKAPMSRSQWLQSAAGSLATLAIAAPAAYAKDVDPAVKGTRKDPDFEACLSQCVYECTKPKGEEQKSRAQCLGECKKTCAKTSAQSNTLTPKE